MLNSITNKLNNIGLKYADRLQTLLLRFCGMLSSKNGWWFIALINMFFIAGGLVLLGFAAEAGPLLGKTSWDALIYYHDQFLFLGRLLLYMAAVCDLCFYLFKK